MIVLLVLVSWPSCCYMGVLAELVPFLCGSPDVGGLDGGESIEGKKTAGRERLNRRARSDCALSQMRVFM